MEQGIARSLGRDRRGVSEICSRGFNTNVLRKKEIAGKDPKNAEEVRVSSTGVDGCDELDETRGKGKGNGNGGKGEHGSKGGLGSKGFQQSVEMMKGEEEQGADEEDELVVVDPNMGVVDRVEPHYGVSGLCRRGAGGRERREDAEG